MNHPVQTVRPNLWRQFTSAYAALLSWLLVFSVGILVVPVTLQIELVQGTQAETLAMKIVANSKDPFFDPRTVKGTLSVALTPEVLARFAPGPALIRATARGRSQWMREPPPLIREVPVLLESAFTSREAPRGVSAMRVRARNLLKRGGRAAGCSIVS